MADDRPASQSIFALEFDEDIKGLGFDCEIVYFWANMDIFGIRDKNT